MDAQKALIAEFDREAAKTRKMLDAIPADAVLNFKPSRKHKLRRLEAPQAQTFSIYIFERRFCQQLMKMVVSGDELKRAQGPCRFRRID